MKKLMPLLKRNIGVDWKDRRLIAAIYMGQKAFVRVNDGDESEPVDHWHEV